MVSSLLLLGIEPETSCTWVQHSISWAINAWMIGMTKDNDNNKLPYKSRELLFLWPHWGHWGCWGQFSDYWKIVGLRPIIFNRTPGNFKAYYTGIDLEVVANFRFRLRLKLNWKWKLILGTESKRSRNWKISATLHVLEEIHSLVWLSSLGQLDVLLRSDCLTSARHHLPDLGKTSVRPRNEKFFLCHENFGFYFANSRTQGRNNKNSGKGNFNSQSSGISDHPHFKWMEHNGHCRTCFKINCKNRACKSSNLKCSFCKKSNQKIFKCHVKEACTKHQDFMRNEKRSKNTLALVQDS